MSESPVEFALKRIAYQLCSAAPEPILLHETIRLRDLRLRIRLTYRADPERLTPYAFDARDMPAAVEDMDRIDRFGVVADRTGR